MIGEFLESFPGLYVHVPFCAKKCEYCAFYSAAPRGELVNRFVDALICEMESHAEGFKPKTIFFGGGTPSLLNLRQWARILESMERLGLCGAEEWTVECNPATVSLDKARLLKSYGVNRVSMGVQSFDSVLLDRLGRIHTREMIFKSFETLRTAGFDNLNIDLMFGIPGQTMTSWRASLSEALALHSEHLSSYEVIYEEDTPLFAQLQAGQFSIDEDLACEMFEELILVAENNGFTQYEIANFARNGTASGFELPKRAGLHNVNYWRGGQYLGLGPSASSHVNGVRSRNCSDTVRYCERLESDEEATEFSEHLSPMARAGEIAAFGLRMNAGWPFDLFRNTTGFDLKTDWEFETNRLVREGFACMDSERFRLTSKGLRFADWVGEQFLKLDAEGELESRLGDRAKDSIHCSVS